MSQITLLAYDMYETVEDTIFVQDCVLISLEAELYQDFLGNLESG